MYLKWINLKNQDNLPSLWTDIEYWREWITSNQISPSVMSDSLRPHELQHTRSPCPSPTPGVHWDSRLSSQWCHPAISSSVVPFSCPQSLPASESFPMSQLFAWGGQSTAVSALASLKMSANLENSSVATGLDKVSLHSNPKERQCQRMLKLPHNCTHLTC